MADPESFASAYERHLDDVFGFLGYRLQSRQQAEDLTQATFEKALRAWDRYDPHKASVKTWLLVIANNVLIDHYRKLETRPQVAATDADFESGRLGTEPPIDESLGVDPDLEAALDELTDRERRLIALRYGGDLTGPEIAEVTGLSLANVQQILSRSLRGLRRVLEDGATRP